MSSVGGGDQPLSMDVGIVGLDLQVVAVYVLRYSAGGLNPNSGSGPYMHNGPPV